MLIKCQHKGVQHDDHQAGILKDGLVMFKSETRKSIHGASFIEGIENQIKDRHVQKNKDDDQIKIRPAKFFHLRCPPFFFSRKQHHEEHSDDQNDADGRTHAPVLGNEKVLLDRRTKRDHAIAPIKRVNMKRESDGMKTAWTPLFTPFNDRGKITRRNVS